MKQTAAVAVLIVIQSIRAFAGDASKDATDRAAAPPATRAIEQTAGSLTAWKWSLVPFIASQALDTSSSWGLRELNPVLAGSNHEFGAEAAIVKLGAAGAILGVEFLIVKKFPRSARAFSKLNWSAAGVTTGLAAYNFTLR